MAALALVPQRLQTLYTLEEHVTALIETAECVTPEMEAEFVSDLTKTLMAAKDKRDDMGRYLAHCESQIELAGAEIARLRARKASFEKHLERLKAYVVRVMEAEGQKRLEGNTVTFTTRKSPDSVDVFDEAAVPRQYTHAAITVLGTLVEEVLDSLPVGVSHRVEYSIDKADVKQALIAGHAVPGAKLVTDKRCLVRS
jgi:chromosome segregation ATPase